MTEYAQPIQIIVNMDDNGALTWTRTLVPDHLLSLADPSFPYYFMTVTFGQAIMLFGDRMGILGAEGEVAYEFPRSQLAKELFDRLRFDHAQVSKFLTDLHAQ